MKSAVKKILASSVIFAGLPESFLDELADICRVLPVHRGQLIFSEGDRGDGVYLVKRGRVKIYKLSPDGKEQILHFFGVGEPFGEVPVFAGQSFPANAVAMEKGEVLFLPRDAFVALLGRQPALALNLLAVMARRLRQFAQMIDSLSLKEVPSRLASYLLYLSARQQDVVHLELEITKGQLASFLGTIPETLSRILGRMSAQGLLHIEGHSITIRDRAALEEVAAGGKITT